MCAYRSVEEANKCASELEDNVDLETASGIESCSDQLVHNRVSVDEAPYFPGMYSAESSGLSDTKYVLYRYRDLDPREVDLNLLGVFSLLEDAIGEARKRGDGRKSEAAFAMKRGQHFNEQMKADFHSRIAIDEVEYHYST